MSIYQKLAVVKIVLSCSSLHDSSLTHPTFQGKGGSIPGTCSGLCWACCKIVNVHNVKLLVFELVAKLSRSASLPS